MAFPQDPLPLVSEILIDGTWVKLSEVGGASDIRAQQQINITRGRRDIQGQIPPTVCDFTINNRDGRFTNDNPLSPYYKKLPIFTQVRHRIADSSLSSYLHLAGSSANRITTPDNAALDITGDIDLRIEIDPFAWNVTDQSGDGVADIMMLAAKWATASTELSWYWAMRGDGRLYFLWSTGGTLGTAIVRNSLKLAAATQRRALRVTLDVDDGAGNHVTRFYYSDGINGTWTLFSTTTVAGTTSIYSGSGQVDVGGATTKYSGHREFGGRIYSFEMRNGINGPAVANADMRSFLPTLTTGAQVWTDNVGRPWTLIGAGSNYGMFLSDKVRFHGELEAMPQEWDSTGKDCWVPARAGDILQRLSNDGAVIEDPISQYLRRFSTITGHWPLTDGTSTNNPSSAVSGVAGAQSAGYSYTNSADLPGSSGYGSSGGVGSYLRGYARNTPAANFATGIFWGRCPTVNSTGIAVDQASLISFNTTGSNVKWWEIQINERNAINLYGYAADGSTLTNTGTNLGFPQFDIRKWFFIGLRLLQSGGNIQYELAWSNFDNATTYGFTGTVAGTVGRINGFTQTTQTNLPDPQLAHVTILQEYVNIIDPDLLGSSSGFNKERAADRIKRVCEDNAIPVAIEGFAQETNRLGPQPIDTVLNILRDAEKTDGGVLSGIRSRLGIMYTTRNRIARQIGSGAFSHSASHFSAPPKPVPDSFGVVNDVTVTRRSGGSARTIVNSGPRGAAAIGTVTGGDTLNTQSLDETLSAAGWIASLGTYDAPRFPSVPFRLERTSTLLGSSLAAQIAGLDLGRYFTITNLPAHQAPGPIELLAQGYNEVLGNRTMQLDFNSSSFGPWRASTIEGVIEPARWAAANTALLPATSSETILTFVTPGGSMIINEPGTFETASGVSNWSATNGTRALSSAQANSGTFSLLLTATGGFTTAYARQGNTASKARVTAGVQYRAQFLAYAPVAITNFVAAIDWADSGDNYLSTSTNTVALPAATWTYVQVTATAPANAFYASYGPTIAGSPAAGVQVYVDDVYMYPTARDKSQRWITSTEMASAFPMDVMIGGERMTVSAIHGQGEVQCVHVTRAVNGIVKAQVRGESAQLARVTTFGR